jgi:small subunit ribosomal protein S20
MPQHKSAAKRARQSEKRRDRNRAHKARVRTMIKDLRAATTRADAETRLNAVKGLLDRMATRRQLAPNAVARAKSQLERFVNGLG